MSLGVLIQVDGFDPVAAGPVTLRFASVNDERVCHLNNVPWWPVLAELPVLRYELFDGAFTGAIGTPATSFAASIEPWPNFARYQLSDARVQMWTGEVGYPWASWTLRFDGRTTGQPTIADGRVTVPMAVDDRWLDRPLLRTYAGTGGIEGVAALKGTVKPLTLGAARYVPGVLIDPINSVVQISGYGAIEDVEVALDKLVRFGASFGDYASHAALVAAPIPAGRWGTCKAQGLVRFGAPSAGKLSFLVKGDRSGAAGYVGGFGGYVVRICELMGTLARMHVPSFSAIDAARPWNFSRYLDQQTTPREIIQAMAASVNAIVGTSWLGKLFAVPIGFTAPTLTFRADGTALPIVSRVEQLSVEPPFSKLAIEAQPTFAVHGTGDIAFTAELVDLGPYAAGTTYREGNIVQANGSSWIYINPTPTAGNAPPNPTYWRSFAAAGAPGAPGANGAGSYTLIGVGGATLGPSSVAYTGGGPDWTQGAYSKESFVGGAYVSCRGLNPNTAFFFGLDDVPTIDWPNMGVAIYLRSDNNFDIVQDGALLAGGFGPGTGLGTWTPDDVFMVAYAGTQVFFSKNGVVFYVRTWFPNLRLYFVSSMSGGAVAREIAFGATGPAALSAELTQSAFAVQSTSEGSPKPGALNGANGKMVVRSGGVILTGGVSFAVVGQEGCSGSIDGAGNYAVSAVSANQAKLTLRASVSGRAIDAAFALAKVREGRSALRAMAGVSGLTTSGSYVQITSIDLEVPNGATISVSSGATYDSQAAGSTSFTPQVKLSLSNVTDGGADVDLGGSEVLGSQARYVAADLAYETGAFATSGGATNTAGGTKVFRAKLWQRRSSGGGNPINVSGTLEISA